MKDYGMSEELKQHLSDFYMVIGDQKGFKNSELATINLMESQVLESNRAIYESNLKITRIIEKTTDLSEEDKDKLIALEEAEISKYEDYKAKVLQVEKEFEDYVQTCTPSLNERVQRFFNNLKNSRNKKSNLESEEETKKENSL